MAKQFINCAIQRDTMHILKTEKIASVHITANLWRDKTYGNTYNSAKVSVLIQGENKYRDLAVFSLV
jgi:20S proteasome alpha/beta subunit